MIVAVIVGMRVAVAMPVIVALVMRMPMGMPVIMGVIVTAVVMGVPMLMRVGATMSICAAFGRKGLLNLPHGGAEMEEHGADDVIALYKQPMRFDLTGGMAVADMPGDAGQVAVRDLQQGFRRGLHQNLAAVFQQQDAAMIERARLRQIDQKGLAGVSGQHLAAQEAAIVIE